MKISLKQGELTGKEEISVPSGRTYHSYLGIPYAEPPINLLRFQAPKPHRGWDGILEATRPGPPCHQKMIYISPQPFGQEDCLYVNVHVPESTDKCLKPVMVYVHGGGFINGCGDFYEPTYLMEYDIIVVTFNYRLHVLGFLNLGIPQCPGNVGLKDQVLLFQWVRENISAFGGDPNNITAVGESAGAASIHYLMISPLGKGLFDRAIIQSGSALCPWAFTEKQTKFAFQFGEILGCITSDEKELYNFLLKVDVVKLGGAARKLTSQLVNGNELVFVPSLESADNVEPKFLPEHPEELIKKTIPVPLITGINDLEALIFFTEMPNDLLINIWEDINIIPSALRTKTDISSLQQKFKTFYLRDQTPSYGTLPQSIDLLTDKSFAHPFHRTVQTQLQHHSDIPIYAYKFSYVGQLNLHKTLISTLYPDLNFEGASHTDELSYLFNLKTLIHIDLNEESLRMIRTMCTLWTNFIKYGTPTLSSDSVKWNRCLLNNPCYLHIDDEPRVKYQQINEDRMHFWDNLYKEARARNIKLKL